MCKVMIIPRIEDTDKVKRFMEAAHPAMSKSDSDGIGYAALTNQDKLAVERWFDVKKAFQRPWQETKLEKKIINQLSKFLKKENDKDSFEYNSVGDLDSNWKAVLYHTRYATCEKNLKNVHPFISKDGETALIHNGRISNHSDIDAYCPIQSTCDSEAILNAYTHHKVNYNIEEWQELAKHLKGYFAIGVISKDKDGRHILDITRDRNASLYCVFIPALKSEVFCTKIDIIKEACQKLNWKHGTFYEVEENIVFRYDINSMDLKETFKYDRSFSYTNSSYKNDPYTSTGREWEDAYWSSSKSDTNSSTSILTVEEIEDEMGDIELVIEEAERVLGIAETELPEVKEDGEVIEVDDSTGEVRKYRKLAELK